METPSGATTETTSGAADAAGSANPGAESPPAADDASEKARIDELTGNWRESQRNTEHYRARTQELERELAAIRNGKANDAPSTSDGNADTDEEIKTLADFKYDEKAYGRYIRDLSRSDAKREADAVRQEIEGKRTEAQKADALTTFQEKAKAWASAQKLDKPEQMFASPANGGPRVTDQMAEAIMSSDHGPEVLNYLARNVAESRRISALSPLQQAREIGKLEAKFDAAPSQKTVSEAPPPHETVKGASDTAAARKDPAQMTDSEWWASKQRSDRAKRAAQK